MRCKTCGNNVGFLSWLLGKLLHGKSHDCVDINEIIKINRFTDNVFVKESISIIPEKYSDFDFLFEKDKILDNRPKIQITISRDNDVLMSLYNYDNIDDKVSSSHIFLNKSDIDTLIDKLKYVAGKL